MSMKSNLPLWAKQYKGGSKRDWIVADAKQEALEMVAVYFSFPLNHAGKRTLRKR